MDAKLIRQFATSPEAFQRELIIPSAHGPRRFGDCMASFQCGRFRRINPALLAIAKGEKPVIGRHWWEATKGASKDSDLAVCLLWLLAFTKRPLLIQVGAADRDQAAEMQKAAKDILRLNPWLSQRVTVQSWRILCDHTDSVCEIIAADVTGSHGARPDILILNELSHVTKQEFAENLMDNAAKVPQGLAVVATNAGFTGSWQYKWRELARTSTRWVFDQVDYPSPWLDRAEIAEAQIRNSNARFMRLWHGVWASGSGDALDLADIEAATDKTLRPMVGDEKDFTFVAGLDLGVKNDHSALVVLGCNGDTQRIRLASCKSWAPSKLTRQVDLEAVEQGVLEANKRYGLTECLFDPHQAALMAQRLQRQGVRMTEMTFTGKNLDTMATTLMEVFRSRRIDLHNDPRLVSDLMRLTIEEKSYGHKLTAVRDADGHADRAIALAIALPAAVQECEYPSQQVLQCVEDPRAINRYASENFNRPWIPGH